MEEIIRLDRVGDIVDVGDRVHDARLLGADDDLVVVGMDDDRTQTFEL